MGSHRAPESGTKRPSSGPVSPVDTETIDMTRVPAPSGPTPCLQWTDPELVAVQPPAPSGPRPEPVMKAATLAGAISGTILTVGGLMKLATPWVPSDYALQPLADQASNAVISVGMVWAIVGPWITARIKARDKVTPLADPRDVTGHSLVPR